MRAAIRQIVERHLGERRQLLAILRDIQQHYRCVPDEAITIVAEEMDLPRVHVEGTATFYHFLSRQHRGLATVYLNTSATSEMAGCAAVAAAFEEAAGTTFGHTTPDHAIGLFTTSCIGMCDQEPAALINDVVFTRLTPARMCGSGAADAARRRVRRAPLGAPHPPQARTSRRSLRWKSIRPTSAPFQLTSMPRAPGRSCWGPGRVSLPVGG